jgi:acyl-CoA thioesterase FadM
LAILGLRIIETKAASVRLFFQIWDTRDGTVTWEATQELHVAYDTITEKPLTFQEVVGRAARELVSKLP